MDAHPLELIPLCRRRRLTPRFHRPARVRRVESSSQSTVANAGPSLRARVARSRAEIESTFMSRNSPLCRSCASGVSLRFCHEEIRRRASPDPDSPRALTGERTLKACSACNTAWCECCSTCIERIPWTDSQVTPGKTAARSVKGGIGMITSPS